MNSKYYTPTIEEFHVGFECEFKSAYMEDDEEWRKVTYGVKRTLEDKTVTGYAMFDLHDLKSTIDYNQWRVKYLDREDVESLGWVFDHENKFFVFFTKPGFRLGLPIKTDICEPYTYIEMYDKEVGESEFNHRMGMNFVGEIKNKSELKTILKQIGCTEM